LSSSHQSADGSLDTMSAFGTKQTCAGECRLFAAKRTLTNRCLPIWIYKYTALGGPGDDGGSSKSFLVSSQDRCGGFPTINRNI
jgi:hypothetical protein